MSVHPRPPTRPPAHPPAATRSCASYCSCTPPHNHPPNHLPNYPTNLSDEELRILRGELEVNDDNLRLNDLGDSELDDDGGVIVYRNRLRSYLNVFGDRGSKNSPKFFVFGENAIWLD
jgi:hypothetical protein